MAAIAESLVSIRFFGDDLNPAELTSMLGREPSMQYKKGDTRTSSGHQYARKFGAWIAATEKQRPEAVDAQLEELLASMNQDLTVWKSLTSRFNADVFCGLFMDESNEAFSLSPATLQTLANRGLEIIFDVYDPAVEHSVSVCERGDIS
jgi:ribosomal protein L19